MGIVGVLSERPHKTNPSGNPGRVSCVVGDVKRRAVLSGLTAGALFPSLALAESPATIETLLRELSALADAMEEDETVEADFVAFARGRKLEPTAALRRDYARVKLVFEAARDGGWWHLRWDITNRKPNSEVIWSQWKEAPALFDGTGAPLASATAECDELSALFAFLARRLGVGKVGLFWPRWNHVVAVWSVEQQGVTHRVVVPTSQIFLDPEASLGTDGFNPWKQKTIFTYRRKDAALRSRLPKALLDTFVDQAWSHAFEDQQTCQRNRNARSRILDGS